MHRQAPRRERVVNGQENLVTGRGEEDDPYWAELRDGTPCLSCRGRCVDRHGNTCPECYGEGEIIG